MLRNAAAVRATGLPGSGKARIGSLRGNGRPCVRYGNCALSDVIAQGATLGALAGAAGLGLVAARAWWAQARMRRWRRRPGTVTDMRVDFHEMEDIRWWEGHVTVRTALGTVTALPLLLDSTAKVEAAREEFTPGREVLLWIEPGTGRAWLRLPAERGAWVWPAIFALLFLAFALLSAFGLLQTVLGPLRPVLDRLNVD